MVQETLLYARPLSNVQALYAVSWKLSRMVSIIWIWCTAQYQLSCRDTGKSLSMLKLYVAIIAAHYNTVNGVSLWAHKFITTVLKEVECLLFSTKSLMLDIPLLQESLKASPCEPMQNAELK